MSLARSEFKNVENSFAACRSSGNEGAVNIECSKSVWSSSLVVYSYFSQCSQQSTGQPQRSTRIISSSIGVPPPLLAWQFVRSVEQTFKQKMSESVEIVILKSSTLSEALFMLPSSLSLISRSGSSGKSAVEDLG
ncbi:hypothetical protein BLNAU_16851 [Blattamonas nauphoetae]|uniref:Uncharacterized protein n=1 Tax=Blattamonas nauphoetae TaxID=2049346 RepID=A0ABQ9X825_9EUKA|nr:hypothetical protein BLNAU_24493 [Blattamonas nauphoetae]KAK2941234.1 hypothetical protein BLNAU_23853 [Blattamonas nauphoetae]KAK2948232.1 hypothetical protein BLNAU_16851 [Blattamonas nauphoetae]